MSGKTESRAAVTRLAPNGVFGMMAIPACPHERCGWFMPELTCPEHGNFGMTFLSARQGSVTWVKAVLSIPRGPFPDGAADVKAGAL